MVVQATLQRVMQLVQSGDIDVAVKEASSVLKNDPDDSVALALKSYCLLRAKRLGDAEALAIKATEVNSGESVAHFVLAETMLAKRSIAEAMDHARIALSLRPGYPMYLEVLGRIHLGADAPERAFEVANLILENDSDDVNGLMLRAKACFHLAQHDQVLSDVREVLRLQPKNALALSQLGIQMMLQANFRSAISHFQKALEIEPALQSTRNLLAKAQEVDKQGATDHFSVDASRRLKKSVEKARERKRNEG